MTRPNKTEIKCLEDCGNDDEMYHSTFDQLLEDKLMLLDPEWMKAMDKLYNKSGCARWCA